jgi:5-methylcytosine-specific restriction endonuclease McrA
VKKNLERSPRSRITAAIRQLWLRSRERAAAIKRDNYSCTKCGRKQSKAKGKEQKVEVHHIDGIKWDEIVEYIRANVLVEPKKLETLCPECHAKETAKQRE